MQIKKVSELGYFYVKLLDQTYTMPISQIRISIKLENKCEFGYSWLLDQTI